MYGRNVCHNNHPYLSNNFWSNTSITLCWHPSWLWLPFGICCMILWEWVTAIPGGKVGLDLLTHFYVWCLQRSRCRARFVCGVSFHRDDGVALAHVCICTCCVLHHMCLCAPMMQLPCFLDQVSWNAHVFGLHHAPCFGRTNLCSCANQGVATLTLVLTNLLWERVCICLSPRIIWHSMCMTVFYMGCAGFSARVLITPEPHPLRVLCPVGPKLLTWQQVCTHM